MPSPSSAFHHSLHQGLFSRKVILAFPWSWFPDLVFLVELTHSLSCFFSEDIPACWFYFIAKSMWGRERIEALGCSGPFVLRIAIGVSLSCKKKDHSREQVHDSFQILRFLVSSEVCWIGKKWEEESISWNSLADNIPTQVAFTWHNDYWISTIEWDCIWGGGWFEMTCLQSSPNVGFFLAFLFFYLFLVWSVCYQIIGYYNWWKWGRAVIFISCATSLRSPSSISVLPQQSQLIIKKNIE